LVAGDERATNLIFRTYRNTARVAKNAISDNVIAIEAEGKPFSEVSDMVKGAKGREGLESGNTEHGIWTAGMVQGIIADIPTVRELVERIVGEAVEIIGGKLADTIMSEEEKS
jgi:NADH:quinone reductase (non-electrogenic)